MKASPCAAVLLLPSLGTVLGFSGPTFVHSGLRHSSTIRRNILLPHVGKTKTLGFSTERNSKRGTSSVTLIGSSSTTANRGLAKPDETKKADPYVVEAQLVKEDKGM